MLQGIKKRTGWLKWLLWLLVLVIIIAIAVLWYGNSLVSLFWDSNLATITTHITAPDSLVLVDNRLKITTSRPDESDSISLPAGEYLITIYKDGYWPWDKVIHLTQKQKVDVTPILAPQNNIGIIVNPQDQNYGTILSSIRSDELPSQSQPLALASTSDPLNINNPWPDLSVWAEGNSIFAATNSATNSGANSAAALSSAATSTSTSADTFAAKNLFTAAWTIKNLALFPPTATADPSSARPTIIFASGVGIYIAEIVTSPTTSSLEHFSPLYQGVDPYFIVQSDDLFILDGTNITRIKLK